MNRNIVMAMVAIAALLAGCGSNANQTSKNDQGTQLPAQQGTQLMPRTAKQKKQLDQFMNQPNWPTHHVGTGFGLVH